jgi:hypothetical protein
MFSQKSFKYWLMALLAPMLAWALLNKIWAGRFFLGADNTDFFYWFIYYFKNILTGVYPLWNPFKAWGCVDYIDTQALGLCNPLSVIIPILLFFGVKAYWAYASYVVIFWMTGFFGFFFFLNRVYNDPRIAWLGTSLLMFSAGLAVFFSWDLLALYIFMPLGWFFGFLNGFVRSSDDPALKRNMLGLSFSSMFIAHLYVPFYFLTFFLAFIVSVLLFARGWTIQFWGASQRAFKRMPWAALFCVVSVLLSLWPTIDCYLKMKDPQNVTQFYRGENEHLTGNSTDVSQPMIDSGGLPSVATIPEFFSSYETGDQYLSFVPIILFILVLLTLFNRSSRPQRVIFMTGFLLLLMTITNACPLQHFLYKHVYFFRLFRNYFFFWVIFWSCCVVYVMGETKQFLAMDLDSPKKRALYAVWVILVHVGAVAYLMSLEDVPFVCYATVAASCLWFLVRLFEALRLRQSAFIVGLAFIGLWQPFYVLPFIRGVDHGQLDYMSEKSAFSYLRPLYGSGFNEKDARAGRQKYFQDESGFVDSGFMGQKGSYLLQQNLPKETLADYVRYKFILYDQTNAISENNIDWGTVRRAVTFKDRSALIWDPSGIAPDHGNEPSAPVIVKGPSPHFKVIHFDVNSVELSIDLDQRKFLVYNDSFHSGWHVLVDHQAVKLYQANIAFKGVWIGKGRHLVRFYFGSWLDYLRGWGVSLLFIFWFFLVIAVFLPRYRKYHET